MSIDIQAPLQATWHLGELPLIPEKLRRCQQHIDPRDWLDEPILVLMGWIRTTCELCEGFGGYWLANDERSLTIGSRVCKYSYMTVKHKSYNTMTDAIREAIAESELSFKALERETGVLRQSLMKFAAGEQTLRLDAADKLADFFNIEVRRRKVK